jgi:alpha-L-rhamnosidase
VVVHYDLRRIGLFHCSDPMLNWLHENVLWSQRGNFLDEPKDCPQRDGITFGLLDHTQQAQAGDRLAQLAEKAGYTVATGFAGTPYVLDALTDTGHLDTAYRMLTAQDNPSWLYPVTMGATTIWERWDSMLPDGSINPGEMTSFNHYALGAVADWMHRVIGGVAPIDPGYRRTLIASRPGGGITSAQSSVVTPHGLLGVSWTATEGAGSLSLEVTVPEGVTAIVRVPGKQDVEIGPGHHAFSSAAHDTDDTESCQ